MSGNFGLVTTVRAASAVLVATGLLGVMTAGAAHAGVGVAGAGDADRGSVLRLTVHRADVGGRPMAYAEIGSAGAARPLLLLNGTGSPMSQWDPALLSALSADRQVIVYDYPGLGGSAELRGRLTFDRLADNAAALLASIGVPRADVLGWSMGGFVGQRLAVRHPDRVGSLVLAGTNPGGPRTILGPRWVQLADSDPGAGVGTYVRTNYPPGHRAAGWAFVRRVQAAVEAGRYPPDTVPRSTYLAMVAAEDPWLRSDRNRREIADLSARTLIVTGVEDVVTPPANARVLATTIPDARLVLVPDAGHSFLFQRPVATARLIEGFLAAAADDLNWRSSSRRRC